MQAVCRSIGVRQALRLIEKLPDALRQYLAPTWVLNPPPIPFHLRADSMLHVIHSASRYTPLSLAACQRNHCSAHFALKAAGCPPFSGKSSMYRTVCHLGTAWLAS